MSAASSHGAAQSQPNLDVDALDEALDYFIHLFNIVHGAYKENAAHATRYESRCCRFFSSTSDKEQYWGHKQHIRTNASALPLGREQDKIELLRVMRYGINVNLKGIWRSGGQQAIRSIRQDFIVLRERVIRLLNGDVKVGNHVGEVAEYKLS